MKISLSVLCLVLMMAIRLPAYGESDSFQLTIRLVGHSVEDVIRKVCVIHQCGFENREEAAIEAVGCSIMRLEQNDSQIVAYVYTAATTFGVSSGSLERLGGSLLPVKIVLTQVNENEYDLVSYHRPEDGMNYGKSIKTIFTEDLYGRIMSSAIDEDVAVAEADAMRIGEAYMAYCNGGEDTGEWIKVLSTGSNPKAREALNTIQCSLPGSIGTYVWTEYDRVLLLAVEGEQSYSGILTYSIVDHKDNWEYQFTVQTNGDRLEVLAGELPEPYSF